MNHIIIIIIKNEFSVYSNLKFTSIGHVVVVPFSETDIQQLQSICGNELESREIRNLTIVIKNLFGSLNLTQEIRQPHITAMSGVSNQTIINIVLGLLLFIAVSFIFLKYRRKIWNW
jgi:hypothetical protein